MALRRSRAASSVAAKRSRLDLLVVDGYNVMGATPRYQGLIDDHTDPDHLDTDPFVRAREALITDVAAFAQGSYDAVVVFDGAGNLNPEHPSYMQAGVRVMFSAMGESADSVIERLVTEARLSGRNVALVTEDNTIKATVGTVVTRISSTLLVHEVERVDEEVSRANEERTHQHMTLEDRLPADQRAKLWKLLGK